MIATLLAGLATSALSSYLGSKGGGSGFRPSVPRHENLDQFLERRGRGQKRAAVKAAKAAKRGNTEDLEGMYQRLLAATQMQDEYGLGSSRLRKINKINLGRVTNALNDLGIDPASIDGLNITDGHGQLDIVKAQQLKGLVMPRGPDSRFLATLNMVNAQNKNAETTAYYDDQIKPIQDRIMAMLERDLETPAFSAEEKALIGSQATARARSQETARLRRISAGFGIREIDPDSPTGATAVSKAAEEADAQVNDILTRLELEASTRNKEKIERMMGVATNVVGQNAAIRDAVLSGDWDRMAAAQNAYVGLLQSMKESRDMEELQRQLLGQELGASGAAASASNAGTMGSSLMGLLGSMYQSGAFNSGPSLVSTGAGAGASMQPWMQAGYIPMGG